MLATPSLAQTDSGTKAKEPSQSKLPEAARGIAVEDRLGVTLPMDVMFKDEDAQFFEIGSLFTGNQPVMLSFNYSNCPKLCSVQLENMTRTLKDISDKYQVGRDFQMVSVSIDPNEQSSRAKQNLDKYVGMYGNETSKDGWHFLTGKRSAIQDLANATGFKYRYIARQKLYSHKPVFILVSPDGKIVRYIHGLKYEPDEIRDAISQARDGVVGDAINQESYFGLGCFVFDETTGQYTLQAMVAMRLGGLATIVILLVTLVPYWFYKRRGSDIGDDRVSMKPQPTTNI